MQVEGQHDDSLLLLMATGARVSNAYPTFPLLGDNLAKVRLIPYDVLRWHLKRTKDYWQRMGMRLIRLLAG